MTDDFSKHFCVMLFIVGVSLNPALAAPVSDDEMVHNNNYDMVMADDHEPAASMHFQNFDEFFNAEMAPNDAMAEMEMDESRGSMVRAPRPLSPKERRFRQHLEDLDFQRENRVQRSLLKGATRPNSNANEWEKFDYDMLVKHQ